MVTLFTTSRNQKLPVYMCVVPDAVTWKEDGFWHSWDHLQEYTFPPIGPVVATLQVI